MKIWNITDSIGNSLTVNAETKSAARRWYKNTGIRGTIKEIECTGETKSGHRNMRRLDLIKDPTIKNIMSSHSQTMEEARRHNEAVHMGRKIGPNENCPCGSGRKNKRCCKLKRA